LEAEKYAEVYTELIPFFYDKKLYEDIKI